MEVSMNNKFLFLLEVLKSKKTRVTSKELCQCGLCPVVLNQIWTIYETKREDCKIQIAKKIDD
jgi:hypothetical protein